MVKQKFLRVDQGPDNIFEGELRILFMFFQMRRSDLHFFGIRLTAVNPTIQFLNLHIGLMLFVAGKLRCTTVAIRNLVLNFTAVQQMQALSQIGFL